MAPDVGAAALTPREPLARWHKGAVAAAQDRKAHRDAGGEPGEGAEEKRHDVQIEHEQTEHGGHEVDDCLNGELQRDRQTAASR